MTQNLTNLTLLLHRHSGQEPHVEPSHFPRLAMQMNIPIIKQVPPERVGGKTLFCSTDGRFFNAKGRELKPNWSPASRSNKSYTHGGAYPNMTHFNNRLCHHLVYETFIGPRTPGMEIDHINGNKLDWSLSNLQEVTPEENRKRARILRIIRKCAIMDNTPELLPENRTREELLDIFNSFIFKES